MLFPLPGVLASKLVTWLLLLRATPLQWHPQRGLFGLPTQKHPLAIFSRKKPTHFLSDHVSSFLSIFMFVLIWLMYASWVPHLRGSDEHRPACLALSGDN